MDASTEEVLEALTWHPDGAATKVLFIEAPPASGKSTKLVPKIWQQLSSRSPNITGIYAVQTSTEAKLLHTYYQKSQVMKTSISVKKTRDRHDIHLWDQNHVRNGSDEMFLCGHGTLSTMLQQQKSTQPPILNPCLAIFMDLEPVSTALGECLLGQVIQTLRDLRFANRATPISLVLLGSHIRPGQTPPEKPQPSVALFMTHDDARIAVIDPVVMILAEPSTVYYIDKTSRKSDVYKMANSQEPKLVCIDPSGRYTLPPIKNLGIALSSGSREAYPFHHPTSQYPYARVGLSRLELERQASILQGQEESNLQLARDREWLDSVDPCPAQDAAWIQELIILSYRFWSDGASMLMPLPVLDEIPRGSLREARRRLVAMRAVEGDIATGFHPTEIGMAMANELMLVDKWSPDTLLRIMIRLVVICYYKPRKLFSLSIKEALQWDKGENTSAILSKVQADCAGVGAQEYYNGSIWLALGLYENLVVQDKISLNQHNRYMPVADDCIDLDMRVVHRITKMIAHLETRLLPEPVDKTLPTSFATPADRLEAYEILAWSYLHQTVFMPKPINHPNVRAFDITSRQPADITRHFFIPVDRAKRNYMLLENPSVPGYAAFYLVSVTPPKTPNGLVALVTMDLNLIPPAVLDRIENETGEKLAALTRTLYTIPQKGVD
ncbi:hypothetical protein PFICI_09974 [Pestalotiopsis fici W106-1]|uniref:Uncharacterized protein n=1 Tax=Pestalotiopsis fici (strain W106-1 / CGMCC3.15140) TaxID=1229662 RepID=W3WXQ3_PESFW|nr:uncharacterized protein PFICI_09974 [Pestalotiopsis fici W106-1]ETS77912.1 hypothetical protein PFICI_09974 [Pestalotiopsis fici W106-1]